MFEARTTLVLVRISPKPVMPPETGLRLQWHLLCVSRHIIVHFCSFDLTPIASCPLFISSSSFYPPFFKPGFHPLSFLLFFFFFPSYDILNIPPFEEQVENPIERSHEPKCIIVLLEILSGKDNGCEFSGGWLSFREAVHLRNRSCKRLVYIVDNMSITFDRLFSYVER